MSLFNLLQISQIEEVNQFNEILSLKVIDKYAQSNSAPDIISWKHELFIDANTLRSSITDLEQIKNSITSIMTGLSIETEEENHFDDEGILIIDQISIPYSVPTSIDGLKNTLFEIIKRDFDLKKNIEYTFTDESLKYVTNYIVDNFIKYIDGSGVAEFGRFVSIITNQ